MTLNIWIKTQRLIEDCNMQTSLDLQAMRARGVETANAVYDDWVMTKENMPQISYILQDICANMAFALRTILQSYNISSNGISVDIENANAIDEDTTVVEGLLRQYIKCSLLAWWYHYRDAELSKMHAESAAVTLDNLFTQCIPRTGISVGRYF